MRYNPPKKSDDVDTVITGCKEQTRARAQIHRHVERAAAVGPMAQISVTRHLLLALPGRESDSVVGRHSRPRSPDTMFCSVDRSRYCRLCEADLER